MFSERQEDDGGGRERRKRPPVLRGMATMATAG
jgi:hypothetical protein